MLRSNFSVWLTVLQAMVSNSHWSLVICCCFVLVGVVGQHLDAVVFEN